MCIGELGCPSMQYINDMTWAEYLIRLYSYNRQQKSELFKLREVAYASIIGSHLDPKKIPSKEKFMPLKDGDGEPSDYVKERMRNAIKEYKEQKEKLNG